MMIDKWFLSLRASIVKIGPVMVDDFTTHPSSDVASSVSPHGLRVSAMAAPIARLILCGSFVSGGMSMMCSPHSADNSSHTIAFSILFLRLVVVSFPITCYKTLAPVNSLASGIVP